MSFTFAHPTIVIPLKEKKPKWFDGTALIIGSMAPDFEYFIRSEAKTVVGYGSNKFCLLWSIYCFIYKRFNYRCCEHLSYISNF